MAFDIQMIARQALSAIGGIDPQGVLRKLAVDSAVQAIAGVTVKQAEDKRDEGEEALRLAFSSLTDRYRTKVREINGLGDTPLAPEAKVSPEDARMLSPKAENGPYWQRYFQYLVDEHSRLPSRPLTHYQQPKAAGNGYLTGQVSVPSEWGARADFADTTPELVSAVRDEEEATLRAWESETQSANAALEAVLVDGFGRLDRLRECSEAHLQAIQARETSQSKLVTAQESEDPNSETASDTQPGTAQPPAPAPADAKAIIAELAAIADVPIPTVAENHLREMLVSLIETNDTYVEQLIAIRDKAVPTDVSDLQMDLHEIAETVTTDSLAKAWWVFQNVYISTFHAEQNELARNTELLRRLREGERVPRRKIPDAQFDTVIWPEAVRGGMRVVMDNHGEVHVRLARAGELAPAAPFRYWRLTDAISAILRKSSDEMGAAFGEDAMTASDAGSPAQAGLHRYLDWTPLPHRAVNPPRGQTPDQPPLTDEDTGPNTRSLSFSVDAFSDMKQRLIEFAGEVSGRSVKLEGHGTAGTAQLSALREKLFRDIVALPGFEVLENWLKKLEKRVTDPELRKRFGVTATVDNSGFVAICIVEPPEQDLEDALQRHIADAVALSMAHLVKFAVDRDAVGEGGPDEDIVPEAGKDDEAYGLHTALIEPAAVSLYRVGRKPELHENSKVMLATANLATMTVRERDTTFVTRKGTIFEPTFALVELSSRFGRVLDRNLPQLVDVHSEDKHRRRSVESPDGTQTEEVTERARNTANSYRAISFYFNVTSWILVAAFALFCILPSFSHVNQFLIWLTGDSYGLSKREIQWLSWIFFVFSLLRLFAAYGLGRVVHQKREAKDISWIAVMLRNYARAFFYNQAVAVWDIVAFSILASIMLFGPNSEAGGSFLAGSTTIHATFVDVLAEILWALPAISVGIIAQSITNLSTTVTQLQEETGESVALRRLDWVRENAARYNKQLQHIFGKGEDGKTANEQIAAMLARLPKFEQAEAAIGRARERVKHLVESRRRGYVQSSALTVAVVAFLGGLGPIKELKPNDPLSHDTIVARERLIESIKGLEQHIPYAQVGATPDSRYASLDSGSVSATLTSNLNGADQAELSDLCAEPPEFEDFKKRIETRHLAAKKHDPLKKTPAERGLEIDFKHLHLDYLTDLHTVCQRARVSMASTSQLDRLAKTLVNLDEKLGDLDRKIDQVAANTRPISNVAENTEKTAQQTVMLPGFLEGSDGQFDRDSWALIVQNATREQLDSTRLRALLDALPPEDLRRVVKALVERPLVYPEPDDRLVNVKVLIEEVLAPETDLQHPEDYIRHIVTRGDGKVEVPTEIIIDDDIPVPPVPPVQIPVTLGELDLASLQKKINELKDLLARPENAISADLTLVASDALAVLNNLRKEISAAQAEPNFIGPSIALPVKTPEPAEILAKLRATLEKLTEGDDAPSVHVRLVPEAP
ncbi:MAG: hypothetical protein AB8B85_06765, partial [Paracoccaceae bacterium]